mmetsp:Transcript_64540/g.108155  ORF Transcript_64540/g.108155 Transcript_64540/m.108155 type:complete len:333 (-) Transcript_64540:870-1868(-)
MLVKAAQDLSWCNHALSIAFSAWQKPCKVEICSRDLGLVEGLLTLTLGQLLIAHRLGLQPHEAQRHVPRVMHEVHSSRLDSGWILLGLQRQLPRKTHPLARQPRHLKGMGQHLHVAHVRVTEFDDVLAERRQVLHLVQDDLAAQQVQGLDPGGPLIQLRNTGIAHYLLHAPFIDVPVSSVHLQAIVRHLEAGLRQERLHDRGQQRQFTSTPLLECCIVRVLHLVHQQRCMVHEHTGTLRERLHLVKHAGDFRVEDDGVGGLLRGHGSPRCTAGWSLAGVCKGLLVRQLGGSEPLNTHSQASSVHECKHLFHAVVGLPNQVSNGVLKGQHGSR